MEPALDRAAKAEGFSTSGQGVSLDLMSALVQSIPEPAFILDVEERRAVCRNHPVYQDLDYCTEEMQRPEAAVPQQLLHPDDHIDVDRYLQRLRNLDTSGTLTYTIRLMHKKEGWHRFTIRMSLLPATAQGRYFLGVFTDETAAFRSADPGTGAPQMTQLLDEIAHDIRTTLSGIMSKAQLIQDTSPGSELASTATSLLDSAGFVDCLVDDLVKVSHGQTRALSLYREPFNPTEVLKCVASDFAPKAKEKGLALNCNLRPGFEVIGDGRRIRQIVTNLVSNAIKFTEEGSVTLSSATRANANGNMTLRIQVIDTGRGIPEELKERVCTRGFQVSSDDGQKGSGLGLAICRDLVGAMDGILHLGDRPGGGTRFTVEIPLEPKPTSQTASELAGKRVLLVDDDSHGRRRHARLLRKMGAEVYESSSGHEAVLAAKAGVDLVLLDYRLPDEAGPSVAKRLRAELPNQGTLIMALTAYGQRLSTGTCRAAGMDAVLTKPLRPPELMANLQHTAPAQGAS